MDYLVSGVIGLAVGVALLAARGALVHSWIAYSVEEWDTGLSPRAVRLLELIVVFTSLLFIVLGILNLLRTGLPQK